MGKGGQTVCSIRKTGADDKFDISQSSVEQCSHSRERGFGSSLGYSAFRTDGLAFATVWEPEGVRREIAQPTTAPVMHAISKATSFFSSRNSLTFEVYVGAIPIGFGEATMGETPEKGPGRLIGLVLILVPATPDDWPVWGMGVSGFGITRYTGIGTCTSLIDATFDAKVSTAEK